MLTDMSFSELDRQVKFYRTTLRDGVVAGLTLDDVEIKEGWQYFKRLLQEKARRRLALRTIPAHLLN